MTRSLLTCCCLPIWLLTAVALGQSASKTGPISASKAGAPAYQARQVSGQQPIQQPVRSASPAAMPPIAPAMPQPPEWVSRMTVEERQRVDQLLAYWENRSSKVKAFECKFQQWDYEGGLAETDAQGRTIKIHPRTYAEGTVKYADPDKGLYRVEKLSVASAARAGEPPQYVEQNPELGEHWICDGKRIYSFEANKKQVTETPLPPEMQGQAIADGPLPFMFGAKAETLKARYWVHELKPDGNGKFLLEAVPKSRQDAQNFKAVHIVLDEKEYLPESLIVFSTNYDPPKNNAKKTYVFTGRKAEDSSSFTAKFGNSLDPLNLFTREFYEVRIPLGWKKVVENPPGSVPAPPQQAAGPTPPPRPSQTVPR